MRPGCCSITNTAIDGLRAMAVVAVVLFHALPSLLPGGFLGVDVFCVISGVVITCIIRGDRGARFSRCWILRTPRSAHLSRIDFGS
jgi:peptidoglycan/LPS O-acetylase OafA/YrhL